MQSWASGEFKRYPRSDIILLKRRATCYDLLCPKSKSHQGWTTDDMV